MLEIIALIFLCKKIGTVAERKGLSPGQWKLFTVLAWFGGEILGAMLGVLLFGMGNLFGLMLFALVCAFGGYLLIKSALDKKPDYDEYDDNDKIRTDDLRPPSKY